MKDDCPLGWINYNCSKCKCGKEGLCDFPYPVGAGYEENKRISEHLKKLEVQ